MTKTYFLTKLNIFLSNIIHRTLFADAIFYRSSFKSIWITTDEVWKNIHFYWFNRRKCRLSVPLWIDWSRVNGVSDISYFLLAAKKKGRKVHIKIKMFDESKLHKNKLENYKWAIKQENCVCLYCLEKPSVFISFL